MRFGLQLLGAEKEYRSNPKEFFKSVRAMGYQFIEPCILFGTEVDMNRQDFQKGQERDVNWQVFWKEQEADVFLRAAEQAGLRAYSVQFFAEDISAALPSMKRLAQEHQVVQFVLRCPSPVTKEVFGAFAEQCTGLADGLAECGAEILLQNGPDEIGTKLDGKTAYEWILEQCGGKVGAQPDTGWILCGGGDPEEFLWKIADYVKSLHHTDFRKTADGWEKTMPGEGDVNTPSCFQFGRAQGVPQFVDVSLCNAAENNRIRADIVWKDTGKAADSHMPDKMQAAGKAARYLAGLTQYRAGTDSILCSIDTVSGEVKELHRFPYIIEAPNWLKDGSMYFNSEGRIYRYIPKTDTVEEVNTGNCHTCNNDHVPSPDNRLLAVSESRDGAESRIYVTDPEAGTERLVTEHAPSYLHGWSPDGAELAYCAFRKEENGRLNVDIYTISADGGEEVRRTFGEGFNDGPEYSPDGAHIWFNSTRTGLMQVWRMNRDGSEPTQMTFTEENNWFGHVSPDGTKAACLTYRKDELDPSEHLPNMHVKLQLMNYDGSDFHTLLEFFGGQGSINVNSWSPDSRELAFVKYELKHK